jgi:hypothetical protein
MRGRWFRFYDGVLDDPKVQRLPDTAFRAWVNLMCLASRCEGRIAKNWDDISFALRSTIDAAKVVLLMLVDVGLIEEKKNWYEPHNWKERQYKSDSSTGRVKRFRKRSETVSETPPEQSRTEQNRNSISRHARFEEFWLVCPRKVGRGAAEKAWPKAVELAGDAEVLITAMRAFAGQVSGKDPTYIPHPSTWLNRKQWTDEGLTPSGPVMSAEEIEAAKDKADRYFKRGIYAEKMQ